MAKIKVAIWGAPLKSVFIDPNATQGATIGIDLFMPDGSVATIASLIAALGSGGTTTTTTLAHRLLAGLALGDDHPQYLRKDTLTTDGDMYTRAGGLVVRLGIGTNHQVLMSNGTAPVWTTLFANPTALVGLTAVNGTASTAMRSDGAPALDQGIVPTWTGQHTFNLTPLVGAIKVVLESRQINTDSTLTGGGDLTANRTLGINPTYPGQASITTVGTITTGVWNGTKITYPFLQDVTATSRFLGRITAGSGVIEELTGTQATTLLNVFTSILQGLVPASGGGTTNFLRADGTFAVPSGTSTGTVTSVDITPPAAGITASGGPITTSGSITLTLANDLAALEGLGSTGIAVRTAADTWAQRTITGTALRIAVTNGNGVSGNPTIDIDAGYLGQASITTLGTITTGVWNGTAINLASFATGILPSTSFPALTGDVTTSAGSVATTIANNAITTVKINANAVTLAKLATQADQTILGNNSGGAAVPSALTAAQVKTLLAITLTSDVIGTLQAAQEPAHTGDVTNSVGSLALTIANDAVTYAKIQNISATSRFLGRKTAGAGDTEELTAADAKTILAITLTSDVIGTLQAAQFPALTGDVTTSAGSLATTIAAGAVTLAKMANLAANSIIGNNTGSPATPIALTVAQVNTLLGTPVAANPSGLIGMSAVNGVAATFDRSDSTHAIDPAIAPTWTGLHTFTRAAVPQVRLNQNAAALPAVSAGTLFQMGAADGVACSFVVESFAAQTLMKFRRANGTAALPTNLVLNDIFGSVQCLGYGTTGYNVGPTFQALATETWSDTAGGSKFRITVIPNTTIVARTAWQADQDGTTSAFGPTAAALVDVTPDHGTFTGTLTGMTGSVTGTCRWNRVGDCVYLYMPIMTGTSNTTAMTLTGLPAAIQPARTMMFPVGDLENNTILTGTFAGQVAAASGTLTFYLNGNAAGFTASGTKGLATAQVVTWTLF